MPMNAKGRMASLGGKIRFSFRHTMGKRQTTAMIHLKLVKVAGEAWPTSDFPTTKFPPHNRLVNSSNK